MKKGLVVATLVLMLVGIAGSSEGTVLFETPEERMLRESYKPPNITKECDVVAYVKWDGRYGYFGDERPKEAIYAGVLCIDNEAKKVKYIKDNDAPESVVSELYNFVEEYCNRSSMRTALIPWIESDGEETPSITVLGVRHILGSKDGKNYPSYMIRVLAINKFFTMREEKNTYPDIHWKPTQERLQKEDGKREKVDLRKLFTEPTSHDQKSTPVKQEKNEN